MNRIEEGGRLEEVEIVGFGKVSYRGQIEYLHKASLGEWNAHYEYLHHLVNSPIEK